MTGNAGAHAADVQALIDEALEIHGKLPAAQATVDALLAARRAKVMKLRSRGVSGYELARIFGVSQTTIGNWTNAEIRN